jgi:RNA polymerase sigma factor (sigma-70 family)
MNGGRANFPATRWTLAAAARDSENPDSRRALASLCESYWYPLYAFAKRHGDSADEARDHTQAFFAQFLEHRYFDRAEPQRGRFRTFLLSAFQHYLADAVDRSRAQKRGGGVAPLPFEVSMGEEMYVREPSHVESPERTYERRWARALLDSVESRLRTEFVDNSTAADFDRLKGCLQGDADAPYAYLARDLRITEGALKVRIHRMRKRYGELIRLEVAEIVNDPADIDTELRHLITALAPGA